MRPINTTAATAATAAAAAAPTAAQGYMRWNSPVPYLFVGIAAMLSLITLALIFLACSGCKSSDNLSQDHETKDDDLEKPTNPPADTEPKIVVIMAGEDRPTFLANPVPPIQVSQQV